MYATGALWLNLAFFLRYVRVYTHTYIRTYVCMSYVPTIHLIWLLVCGHKYLRTFITYTHEYYLISTQFFLRKRTKGIGIPMYVRTYIGT